MELFPAVMIGGPPHSGKSVLTYSLTKALRERNIAHYALRAYPDGEGDWSNETSQDRVRRIRVKGKGTPEWVANICRDIDNRHLPLIIDVGGRPTDWQKAIFDHCTHAILLTPDEHTQSEWEAFAVEHSIQIIAKLQSNLKGLDTVWSVKPILRGQISGLERGYTAQGTTFQKLLALLTNLFAYDPSELRAIHFSMIPVDLVLELNSLKQALDPNSNPSTYWYPEELPQLLDYLPQNTSFALYDRGPNWLYAALALHAYPAELWQFDVRLGWVKPPRLEFAPLTDNSSVNTAVFPSTAFTRLELEIRASYLEYSEAMSLPVPALPSDHGVVLSGKLPLWLWTALVKMYHQHPWLAIYQPQFEHRAVIVASRVADKPVGSLVSVSS
ncbi:MAG: hypothetical protein KDJ65_35100 [Anaerolineae bacterium]|nr:hypothetical protein [Anaerolineae bacterium]